ncbi:endonuclease/exonuclease/phosphatase family protein [Rosistilla ulvae]|uniref:endonuclease/exonuclease/phosphatase family protein n=1 Tax=Rosistilla ulvae TaxID=1930277 RepID=UPI001C54CA2B|nr:endonuclease/exonuclease/phosphatase family protein [Rosistilla ulvae]
MLCYNIHYGQGNDGVYDLERLARVIVAAKPDLVALQELDVMVERSGRVHQAQRLAELTGLAVRMGPTQHYQGGLFGNAVLTRMPIEDVQIHPLPYTPATESLTTYPRGAISVVVQCTNGRPLRFVSTHFQHNVPGDRVAEAEAINRLFGTDNVPTVLAGDMNSVPGSEPIEILGNRWNNAIDLAASPTAPAKKPTSRIDYIFYRGGGLKMVESRVVDESMASDHRPVLAVFKLAN